MQPAEIAVGQELGFFWTLTALWQEPDLLHVRLHLPAIERESLETCNLPCNLMSVLVGSSRTGPVRMLVIAPTDTELANRVGRVDAGDQAPEPDRLKDEPLQPTPDGP